MQNNLSRQNTSKEKSGQIQEFKGYQNQSHLNNVSVNLQQMNDSFNQIINKGDELNACLLQIQDKAFQEKLERGDLLSVIKIVASHIVIMNYSSKEFQKLKNDQNASIQESLHKDYEINLRKLPYYLSQDYLELVKFPVNLVFSLIKELVQDCTYTLDINYLPDDKEYSSFKKARINEYLNEDKLQDEPYSKKFVRKYEYKKKVDPWKYDILEYVLQAYHEPYLNLHFLGPYLKENNASLCSYDLIFQILQFIPQLMRTEVLKHLINEIKLMKERIIQNKDENSSLDNFNQIMPLFHILIFLLIKIEFTNHIEIIKELAQSSHELRLMPLPYGLLPHEIIEIIDNERILPGISFIYKTGEDFPYLNHYSYNLIESDQESSNWHNWHQRVLLFESHQGSSSETGASLCKYLKRTKPNEQLLSVQDFNSIRYSFLYHLFDLNDLLTDDLKKQLEGMKSWNIWNIFKQLSFDFFDKADGFKYMDIESKFKEQVVELIKNEIKKKLGQDQDKKNEIFYREFNFKILSDPQQISQIQKVNNNNSTDRSEKNMEFNDSESNKLSNKDNSKKNQPKISSIETFIKAQTEDKQNVPPIRILVVGDDKSFNKFLVQYTSLLSLDLKSEDSKQKSQDDKKSGAQLGAQASKFMIDRNKLDIRVYFVPQGSSTLAHYLAMYDDLYCHNVYNFFNSNSLLNIMSVQNRNQGAQDFQSQLDAVLGKLSSGQEGVKQIQQSITAQSIDRNIQSYIKDAIRNVEIKIFKAEITLQNGQMMNVFFVNRLELGYANTKGTSSVYEKMDCLKGILNATNRFSCKEAYEQQLKAGFTDGIDQIQKECQQNNSQHPQYKSEIERSQLNSDQIKLSEGIKQHQDSIQCKLSVRRMDYLGKEYLDDSQKEAIEAHFSYFKLINVPSMFDVGCTQADPQTEFLTLSMMDSITHKVFKQSYAQKTGNKHVNDIEKLRQQLLAIHTNMQVCSATLFFDQLQPLVIGGSDCQYLLTIDGIAFHKRQEKLKIVKIFVSRLLNYDGSQATVPVMTFLPLKEGELKNQNIQVFQDKQ